MLHDIDVIIEMLEEVNECAHPHTEEIDGEIVCLCCGQAIE